MAVNQFRPTVLQWARCEGTVIPDSLLVRPSAVRPTRLVKQSYFAQPIMENDLGINGRSRSWGDIEQQKQAQIISTLVYEGARAGLTREETAFLLAVTRVESGFNPDAASSLSSASGLGQFIDATGSAYGLSERNRFHILPGARALIQHLRGIVAKVRNLRSAKSFENIVPLAYGYHHDGPALQSGGVALGKERVLPWYRKYQYWLEQYC